MTAFEHDQHIPIDDLSAYADGEALSPDERGEIEAHLAVCETCRDELESLRAISTLLADLPEPDAPRSFRLSASDVAPEPASPEPTPIVPWIVRRQSTFRVAAMAAALLLALVVTIDLLPGDTDESAQDDADSPVTMMQEADPESDDESEGAAPDPGTMDADQEEADEEAAMDQEEEAAEESDDSDDVADEDTAMGQDEEAAEESDDAGDIGDEEADEDAAMDQDEEAAEESDDSGDIAGEESGAADGEEADDAPESADDEQIESEEEGEVADTPEEDAAQEESESAEEEALEAEDDAATDESDTEDDVSRQEAADLTQEEPADDTAVDPESGADRDGEPADEIAPADEPDEGVSGLRILAGVLAVLTVTLVIAGFVIPRWWSSSDR